MAERQTRPGTGPRGVGDPAVHGDPAARNDAASAPTVAPSRWGPASWWRIGLLALLALLIGLALAGGAFWTATPVDAPR